MGLACAPVFVCCFRTVRDVADTAFKSAAQAPPIHAIGPHKRRHLRCIHAPTLHRLMAIFGRLGHAAAPVTGRPLPVMGLTPWLTPVVLVLGRLSEVPGLGIELIAFSSSRISAIPCKTQQWVICESSVACACIVLAPLWVCCSITARARTT